MKNETKVERKSDREVVVTRVFDAPPRLVFEAWTKRDLFVRWWVPKSAPIKLLSCEMDVRVGGTYRLEFDVGAPEPMAFFGTYVEVVPESRLVWTNDESGEAGRSITTVTFEDKGGKTLVIMSELHASKEALESSGGAEATHETYAQLDEVLATLV